MIKKALQQMPKGWKWSGSPEGNPVDIEHPL